MKELFDLDYLGKDMTGNAEIQSAVDRGIAFMKLEKWDKALQVFEELIDMHPESPCGWFGKARLATNDYTIFTLTTEGGRTLVAQTSECLEAAVKLIDAERKDEYLKLQATYSDRLKKDLVSSYINSFSGFVDACENVEKMFRNPDHRMFMICESFSKAVAGNDGDFDENTIYKIPVEIITETGKDYPSLNFAALHIIIMNEVMKPYFEAQNKQAHAKRVQEARFDQRRRFNQNQGFGYSLDRDEIEKLSKECPVYELSHYYKYSVDSEWSLAKLIKDNSVFEDVPLCDEKVKEVFEIYFRFFRILELPLGNLKACGIPDEYYQEIESVVEQEEKRKKELEIQKQQEAQEQKKKEEKEREEAAARAKTLEGKKRKAFIWLLLLIVCWGVGGVLWSSENLLALPLFGVGIVCLIVYKKKRKKL